MELRYRVAVMDNEPLIRRGMKISLEKEGISTRIATSVSQLIDIVENDHFDASVIDIRMSRSGTEGLDAVKVLRKIHPAMYIEVLTAFREYEDEAYSKGADLVVFKAQRSSRIQSAKRIRYGIMRKRLFLLSTILGIKPSRLLKLVDVRHIRTGQTVMEAEILSKFAKQYFDILDQRGKDFGLNNRRVKELKKDLGQIVLDTILHEESSENVDVFDGVIEDPGLETDENYIAYLSQLERLLREYGDTEIFVAFVDGKFVGAYASDELLQKALERIQPNKTVFIKKLEANEPRIDLYRPKRVVVT